MKTLIVMPTYNEAGNLEAILGRIFELHPEVEVLVVDDNSPDGTGKIADELAAKNPRIHVKHREQKSGLGQAYIHGFLWGAYRDYEYICEMDADGSHRPEDLAGLFAEAPNADLVIGSRWVEGGSVRNWPKSRLLISRAGNWYARKMLGSPVRDITAGFRVYKSSILREVEFERAVAQGYGFQVEMVMLLEEKKAVIKEVPIEFVERTIGASKMTGAIVFEAMRLVTLWGAQKFLFSPEELGR